MPAAILLDAAIAFLKRYKSLALVLPLLMALALSHCSDRRHTKQRDEARAENVALIKAAKKNAAAQIAQVKAIEAKSEQIAREVDHAHEIELADARAAADRYIATHRVQSPPANRSAPSAPSEGNSPFVPDAVPAGSVLVSERDVQACTAATSYAIDAHNHAMERIGQGLAVPAVGF